MKLLVTGYLGFIGSHAIIELQQQGFEVVIIDILSNSSIDVLKGITAITKKEPIFEKMDLRYKSSVSEFFKSPSDVSGVIHFTASKADGDCIENPLLYYENNINSLIYLLQELQKKKSSHFIISSSCTVYDQVDSMPIIKSAPIKTEESPYGNTKQISEEIIVDTFKVSPNIDAIALRYFNPIGAHKSAKIDELLIGTPQNLVPFITQTGIGIREQLWIFNEDYPNEDETCIRDYIHVVDLVKAHVSALQRLVDGIDKSNFEVLNIGTGKRSSVLEVILAFEKVSGQKLNYEIVGRRESDVVYVYDVKANSFLSWKGKSFIANTTIASIPYRFRF